MRQKEHGEFLPRIERLSLIDEVVGRIRTYIETYHHPGDRLPTEHQIKDQLAVGRSTVREALRVLQALGVVEIRAGKGTFVRDTAAPTSVAIKSWLIDNQTKIGDLFEARSAIEELAVRLAVARGTEEQIERIEEIERAFEIAVPREDNIELAMLDESLHNAIIEASNNRILMRIGRLIANALVEYRTRSFAVQENIRNAVGPHREIVRALQERNENAAVKSMRSHLAISLDDVERLRSER